VRREGIAGVVGGLWRMVVGSWG